MAQGAQDRLTLVQQIHTHPPIPHYWPVALRGTCLEKSSWLCACSDLHWKSPVGYVLVLICIGSRVGYVLVLICIGSRVGF